MKHFIHLMIAVFICSASKRLQAARITLPSKRSFLSINHNHNSAGLQILSNLRVLQLNVLADGLSGLRSDLGGFSRARKDWLNWDKRKHMLLREILQHDPDIITLQECDHYHDFFLPALADQFDGVFSPKPASACLEVSQRSDGCAIFVRRSKLKLVSTETITYALPYEPHLLKISNEIAATPAVSSTITHNQQAGDGKAATSITSTTKSTAAFASATSTGPASVNPQQTPWKYRRLQNQVALITVCELIQQQQQDQEQEEKSRNTNNIVKMSAHENKDFVPIIVATTHLKAAKTAKGEHIRLLETEQMLSAIDRCAAAVLQGHPFLGSVPVILAADLNSVSTKSSALGYESTVYPFIKKHPVGYRSVLNDDVPVEAGVSLNDNGICDQRGDERTGASTTIITSAGSTATTSTGDVWTTWKARWKHGTEIVVKHCIDYIIYANIIAHTPAHDWKSEIVNMEFNQEQMLRKEKGNVVKQEHVIRAVAALAPLQDEEIGNELLPSQQYPSDHVAIAADLQVLRRIHSIGPHEEENN